MSDIRFPAGISAPKPPIKITPEDIVLKSPTESGFTILRPRFTRARRTFEVNWDLRGEELQTFWTFYSTTLSNGTSPFYITLTMGSIVFTDLYVYFAVIPLVSYEGIDTWTIECVFMEV